jgi:hypothetical protein
VVYLPAAKPLLAVIGVAGICLLPGVGGAVAALVVRFRRSRGIERQQLKWFTYAAALAPLPFLVYEVVPGGLRAAAGVAPAVGADQRRHRHLALPAV